MQMRENEEKNQIDNIVAKISQKQQSQLAMLATHEMRLKKEGQALYAQNNEKN